MRGLGDSDQSAALVIEERARSPVELNVTVTGNEHRLVTTAVDVLATVSRTGGAAWAGLATPTNVIIEAAPHTAIRSFMINPFDV